MRLAGRADLRGDAGPSGLVALIEQGGHVDDRETTRGGHGISLSAFRM
jgi:hypothetical protein